MNRLDLKRVFTFTSYNKISLQSDTICGCYYCMHIFHPDEITSWIYEDDEETDENATAVCPYCGIDAIIGSYSGNEITEDFLHKMHKAYF